VTSKPRFDELKNRIQRDTDAFNGKLPESFSIAWSGYLAALIEWDLLSIADHERLVSMLPKVQNNPSVKILLGRQKA
jgi:hypothetical protein